MEAMARAAKVALMEAMVGGKLIKRDIYTNAPSASLPCCSYDPTNIIHDFSLKARISNASPTDVEQIKQEYPAEANVYTGDPGEESTEHTCWKEVVKEFPGKQSHLLSSASLFVVAFTSLWLPLVLIRSTEPCVQR
jgi:hypothetical protein